jgi:diguanylate cyclase
MRVADNPNETSDRQIELGFQPKVDLRSAAAIGVAAVTPEPQAAHDARSLTEGAIGRATRAAGDWWHSGLGLQLSITLPGVALTEPDWPLEELVAARLAETDLPGDALQFEIGGDVLLNAPVAAAAQIKRLRRLGASISIDRFGTGHFSLRQLQELSPDELKLEPSLIVGLNKADDKAIVRSVIHLAHSMGIRVVAERVDTARIWRQLRTMGCDRAQGSLIAAPLAARQIPAWLVSWSQRASRFRPAQRDGRLRHKAAAASSRPG